MPSRTRRTSQAARARVRAGFSLVEIMVVVMLGAILATIGVPRINVAFDSRAVTDGRDAVVWFAARARATALQTGVVTRLEIDPATDLIRIQMHDADSTEVDARDLHTENSVDVTTSGGNTIIVCYSPRGWAMISSCSANLPATITVTRNAQQAHAAIRTLGQVERVQ